ncbi:hypothetical protein M885DRAFT_153632 [Pelagophyceae sp. CCMP2097]|nr:hypothetical protein M885DRAFT_153632 [Pelagophyceae sp. CCMP2097]
MSAAEALIAQLTAELGPQLFAVIGGATDKLAAMKAQLLKRKVATKTKFAIFDGTAHFPTPAAIAAALASDQIVAVRCGRDAALKKWPELAKLCEAKVGTASQAMPGAKQPTGAKQPAAKQSSSASEKSPHVSAGSLVCVRVDGAVAWCLGGWLDQREVQRAGQAVVAEAKLRAETGRRDFFVSRPRALFDDAEKAQRLTHLFPSVKDASKLKIDEEAAYSASNEHSAAKVAKIARALQGAAHTLVDATACVGGNALA